MNWCAELCELYDKNAGLAGVMKGDEAVLLPLYHTSVAAQITVTIDENGNFLDASVVADEGKATIIPVTEKSAGRTAGKEPHPLCDNLEYLAGDDPLFAGDKDCVQKHELYMEELRKWAESAYTHPKVQAIYEYMKKGSLIEDLCAQQVFVMEQDGRISTSAKIQAVAQTKALVRFQINTSEVSRADSLSDDSGAWAPECWKDRSLQQSYVEYCRAQGGQEDISYLTGEKMPITYYHSKKIRNEGDGAKLISSNDSECYTYRGRFTTKEEAFSVGYEDSQKMHNALKWIIRKQGKNCGDLCIVTWDSVRQSALDWMEDTDQIGRQAMADQEEDGWQADEWSGGSGQSDELPEGEWSGGSGQPDGLPEGDQVEDDWPEEDWESDEPQELDTGEVAAARFRKAIDGYNRHIDMAANTVIMAFDAATPGRLSMVENKSYATSRYVQNIRNWYDRCEWEHRKESKEKGRYYFRGMVGVRDAAELLYGIESGTGDKKFFSLSGKEGLYKEVVRKLLPCILDGKQVPRDMVNLAVRRASSPLSFESRFLWERVLSFACSLVKQDQSHKVRSGEDGTENRGKRKKEEWTMSLDVNCPERDYLYGRLLALADRVEYRTYYKDDDKKGKEDKYSESKRQTNAKRYMSAFSQHPFKTWKILEEKLEPYWTQLRTTERLYYQNIMDEIFELFDIKDFENDNALSGVYLIGFHNQSYALRKGTKSEKQSKDEKAEKEEDAE